MHIKMKKIHSIKHIKKYRNGKVEVDIIEENKNGVIKINNLRKTKCVPFRRNHLLFTNKRRGKSVAQKIYREFGRKKRTQKRRQK
jgi:hypothetical protein